MPHYKYKSILFDIYIFTLCKSVNVLVLPISHYSLPVQNKGNANAKPVFHRVVYPVNYTEQKN